MTQRKKQTQYCFLQAVTVHIVHQNLGTGLFFVNDVPLVSFSSPLLFESPQIVPIVLSDHPAPLATLFSLDKALLLMTSKLNLGIAGVTALVTELHRWPVVVGASLHEVEWRRNRGMCIYVVHSKKGQGHQQYEGSYHTCNDGCVLCRPRLAGRTSLQI